MATSRPFAYNTGAGITGTDQLGSLAVGTPTVGFSATGLEWWNGPDEDLGYVIAASVPLDTQPTSLFSGAPLGQMSCSTIYKGPDINLSNNNQTASQQFGYQMSVLTNTSIDNNDKVMFSVLSTSLEPLTLPQSRFIGVGKTTMNYQGNPYGGYPGNDTQSVGFNAIGEYYYNGSVGATGLPTWTSGDIVDVLIDHSVNEIWIRVNGGNWNNELVPENVGNLTFTNAIEPQYLTVPGNSAFDFGTGDFTIEGWIYVNSYSAWTGGLGDLVEMNDGDSNYLICGINSNGGFRQVWNNGLSGSATASSANTLVPLQTWTHFALVRNGDNLTTYLNGVCRITSPGISAASMGFSNRTLGIGADPESGNNRGKYNLTNIRIVKGTAVYNYGNTVGTTYFTPPTTVGNISGTQLLIAPTTSTLTDLSSNAFTITKVGSPAFNNPPTNANGIEIIGGLYYPALCPGYEGTMTIQNTSAYDVPSGYTLLGANINASVGFFRSSALTDPSFISLSNTIAGPSGGGPFASGSAAKTWLNDNMYWTSYVGSTGGTGGTGDFNVTITQVGDDVVWSGSGSFNLTSLTSAGPGGTVGGYNSGQAIWAIGPNTSVDTYSGTITYPFIFGTSSVGVTSNTGSTFGILPGGSGRLLYVPSGYVSNTNISGTSTYANTTIAGAGLTPGTYTWSWGSGANTSTLVMTIS